MAVGWAVLAGMLLIPQKIIHEEQKPDQPRACSGSTTRSSRLAIAHPGGSCWLVRRPRARRRRSSPCHAARQRVHAAARRGRPALHADDRSEHQRHQEPAELLQQTDKLIKTFPEVVSVYGKIGRADTATDPAPLVMVESVVQLNPDREASGAGGRSGTSSADGPAGLRTPVHGTPSGRTSGRSPPRS